MIQGTTGQSPSPEKVIGHMIVCEGQERRKEKSAWIHQTEVMLDQHDNLLQEDEWLGR